MKKIIVLNLLMLFPALLVMANGNRKAIDLLSFDLTEPAQKTLLQNIQSNNLSQPELAEAHYYLGDIYYAEKVYDSAREHYEKGLEADPSFFQNSVGLAKIILLTDRAKGEDMLKTLANGKNKKNIELHYAIAKAYFDAKIPDKAAAYIQTAKKINSKYAPLYALEGDILNGEKEVGKACSMYEQAIYFDAAYKPTYIKYARAYAQLNMSLAIDMLQKLAEIDPTSFLVYREIGDVYYKNNQYTKAAQAYEKYMQNSDFMTSDYPKYATILFFNGDLNRSIEIAEQGLKEEPDNFILNRILMYNYCEQKRFEEGMKIANKFMNRKDNDFIALDHIFYARLLQENKNVNEAISQYETALSLDSSRVIIYKELADLYEDMGQHDNAIRNYDLYMTKNEKQVMISDYFALGKMYYNAATTLIANASDNEDNKQAIADYANEADKLFLFVAEKAPDSYLGNFWQARINSVLDPETESGLAKPYYESAINLIDKNNPKDAKNLIECYSYLGYYYYLHNNKEKSKEFWNKITDIDPNNKTALDALKSM